MKEEYSRSVLPQLEVSIGGRMLARKTAANQKEKAKKQEEEGEAINDIVRREKRPLEEDDELKTEPSKKRRIIEKIRKIQTKRRN